MIRIKIWLILISISLILLDKFSFISKFRDGSAVYIQKQLSLLKYRVTNYPHFVMLEKTARQDLEKENRELKRQVEQYDILVKQQTNSGQKVIALNELNASKNLYADFKSITARAIIDVNYLINNKLLIDKGRDSLVNIGFAVVNKDGVIGQINSTNPNNAQVRLITNPDYKIYLQNNTSKSKMLAQGIGNNNLLVKYIDKKEKIAIGDILVTTGLDDIYPANIPVAKVMKVFYENNGFNSAICIPVVDFNKLQYVLVLHHAN
jgi:rod shape-determining protein MreC